MIRKAVMMVDDNVDLLEVAKALFDSREFLFVTAKDGAEAMFKAQNQKFDAIICDIRMPRMDGVTFIKEFRRNSKTETPVLIYSGHLDEIPPALRDLKSVYRLAKPSQGYELVQRVRSLVGSADTTAQAPKILPRRFTAGSFIFREGERGAEGFMIDDGEVEIIKEFSDGTEVILDVLTAGEFLGTWAPNDSQFRFHSARAKTAITLTEINQGQIQKEMEGKPAWFQALVRGKHARLNTAFQRLKKQLKAS